MAINLGAEVALALHLDTELTYADIETALTGAGFTDYTILRSRNYDGSADVQLFVRNGQNPDGSIEPLNAGDTMTALSRAVATMADTEGGNNPPTP